jgi:16S rRNA (guanine1207-N2)-methyltransferase
LCLIEATRDRDENLYHIALAWSLLAPGGTLVLSAANALGGESLAKRIRESGLTLDAVYSKAKCRVVSVTRPAGGAAALPPEWLALGDYRELPGTGLVAGPGVFSAHAVDPGSRLLCEALDTPLTGRGADFGAGYGALSHHVLAQSPGIRTLDLYEAESKALAAAKINLAAWQSHVELGYRWTDITATAPGRGYDWIMLNPPFHSGTAAEPALGQRFINAAANSLDSRGALWMVANRHLPYETVLGTRFKQVADLGQSAGYKVYRASRPINDRTALHSSRPLPHRVRHRSG